MIRCTLYKIKKKEWEKYGRCPHIYHCTSYGNETCIRTHDLYITNKAFNPKKDVGRFFKEEVKSLAKEQKAELKSDKMKVLHIGAAGMEPTLLTEYYRKKGIVSHMLLHSMTNVRVNYDINLSVSPYLFSVAHNIRSMIKNLFNGNLRDIFKYDVYHIHWGAFLLPNQIDLWFLKNKLGKKVLLDWKGQDVRMWDFNRIPWLTKIRQTATTPDLVDYSLFPGQIEWVPFGIDLGKLDSMREKKKFSEDNPLIIHPTNNWPVKGTESILRVIKELKKEKRYKFRFLLNNNLPYDQTLRNYLRSDICVDWMNHLYGTFCAVSIENMALGNVVCASTNNQHMELMPDCPVVDVQPHSLKEKLIYLIENPSVRKDLGRKGVKHTHKVYDIKNSAKRYLEIYNEL